MSWRYSTEYLTTYQDDIVSLLNDGLTHAKIAEKVGLSRNQVKGLVLHYQKMGLAPLSNLHHRRTVVRNQAIEVIRELIVTEGDGFLSMEDNPIITYTRVVNGVQHFRCNQKEIGRIVSPTFMSRKLIDQACGDDYHFQASGDEMECLQCGCITVAKKGDSKFCPLPMMNKNMSKCAAAYYSHKRWHNLTPEERVVRWLRGRMRDAVVRYCGLDSNYNSTRDLSDYIGYTIEALFDFWFASHRLGEEYTRENIREWCIDHIRPVSSFTFTTCDLNDPQWVECWSMENLQPLCREENNKKGSNWMGYRWRQGLPCNPSNTRWDNRMTQDERIQLKTRLLRKHYEPSNQPTISGEMNNE